MADLSGPDEPDYVPIQAVRGPDGRMYWVLPERAISDHKGRTWGVTVRPPVERKDPLYQWGDENT